MHGVKRYSIFAILLVSSASLAGQIIKTAEAPKNLKDTVYIGIVNKIKLEDTTRTPVSVQSANTRVILSGKELVIYPNSPGELIVMINYGDTSIKRKFFSTYLLKPSR